jgi:cobyrinic acid a,c-diamide synthase
MSCLIAAPCSGSGKTLLSLSLAAVARQRGETFQPFKVGPDYLDPQLLSAVAGRPCRNLDPLLCGEAWLRRSYRWHGGRADHVLVEGVMGLFDGRGSGSEGSSAAVAELLGLSVVLVVEASRQAGSLAALVRGFRDHGPPRVTLAGVVLNRVSSERHRSLLGEALASIDVPLLGVLPNHPALELPSRHLGLLTPGELGDLRERQRIWAHLAEEHLDLPRIWPLLAPPASCAAKDPILWCLQQGQSRPGDASAMAVSSPATRPSVAIASDAAFHFRYPEAQELLEGCGLRPLPWSPLADDPLPPDCRAVLLPGGYPELHARQLAASQRSLGALVKAGRRGLPIVAECGGLLLLGQQLEDGEGVCHRMTGLLPFSARRGSLSLGYRSAWPARDGLLVRWGEGLIGHEFHRWQLVTLPPRGGELAGAEALWQLEGWGTAPRIEGWTAPNVHASWLHLHWAGCPEIPWRLARAVSSALPPGPNVPSCSQIPEVSEPLMNAGA